MENCKIRKIDLFLKTRTCDKCFVEITGKAVNHGDLKGMKAPCIIKFVDEGKTLHRTVDQSASKTRFTDNECMTLS